MSQEFIEQFPSLLEYNQRAYGVNFISAESLREDIIIKFCLDKQKFIDALNKLNKQPSGTEPIRFLRQELGL